MYCATILKKKKKKANWSHVLISFFFTFTCNVKV